MISRSGGILNGNVFQDRSLPFVIGLVVLIVIAVVLFVAFPSLFFAPDDISGQPSSSQEPSASGKPTIAQAQAVVMPKSQLTLPAITKAVDIQLSAVPQVLRDVVPSDARSVTAKRLTDIRSKTGYMIIFDLTSSMSAGNRIMVLEFQKGWQTLSNTYTAVFGLLEAKGNGYDVQVQMSEIETNHLRIVIRAQKM